MSASTPTFRADRLPEPPAEAVQPKPRLPFEAPRLERRGALPKVTTAFGATFNP